MKEIKYTRTFTGKDGQERKEYILVGYLFEKDGRQSILLKNYINPAALANEKGEVWLNVYEPKPKEERDQKVKRAPEQEVKQVAQAVGGKEEINPTQSNDEDVPF